MTARTYSHKMSSCSEGGLERAPVVVSKTALEKHATVRIGTMSGSTRSRRDDRKSIQLSGGVWIEVQPQKPKSLAFHT